MNHSKSAQICHKIKQCILIIGIVSLSISGCRKAPPPIIPKEGEVVTWRPSSELIIRAVLGERREHIPDTHCTRCEDEFYRPEQERYLGQFPVDYEPEKFPTISEEEAKKAPLGLPFNGLEFNLMLNGAKAKATDRSMNLELDDVNQVKVQIDYLGDLDDIDFTESTYEKYKESPEFKQALQTHEFGLDCSTENGTGIVKKCFGASEDKQISGVYITSFGDDGWLNGQSSALIYGGIRVNWKMHRQNLKHWKEVDAAIWRLLGAWNVSPHPETPIYFDKNKEGDLVAWQLAPQLIIKTNLGQRKVKSYKSFDSSRFLGQFAIDYQPKKESLLDNKVQIEDISNIQEGLTFNLLLNQKQNLRIYDFYSRSVEDQVKVSISRSGGGGNTQNPREWIKYLLSLGSFIITGEKFDRFGMECYPKEYGDLICIVKANNSEHSEFLIQVDRGIINYPSTGSVTGEVFTEKYGGYVSVRWRTALANLKDWQEIDSAIWRHLDTWNVAQ